LVIVVTMEQSTAMGPVVLWQIWTSWRKWPAKRSQNSDFALHSQQQLSRSDSRVGEGLRISEMVLSTQRAPSPYLPRRFGERGTLKVSRAEYISSLARLPLRYRKLRFAEDPPMRGSCAASQFVWFDRQSSALDLLAHCRNLFIEVV